METILKRKPKFLIFLFIILFLLCVKFGSLFDSKKIDLLANKIIKTCAGESDRASCYDIEVPKLLERNFISFEEAFAVTKIIQKSDRSYLFCHVLGHNLADIETKKDTSKWLDVVTRCPALECNNGCPHGAIMRRFKGQEVLEKEQVQEIISDLEIACEPRGDWKPTEVESFMCYHSMGHVLMYITGGDIKGSLDYCKKIGIKSDGRDYYQTCTQGVFMIIFQGIDPEDVALVKGVTPKKEDLVSFCSRFNGVENTACRTEAWPLFYEEFNNPSGLENFCSFAKNEYDKAWCLDTVLRGPFILDLLNTKGVRSVADYCISLPNKSQQEYCFSTIATAWVQNEPDYIRDSISLCELAKNYGLENKCYDGLLYYSKYSFHAQSPKWQSYCESFGEPYKKDCLSQNVPDEMKGINEY